MPVRLKEHLNAYVINCYLYCHCVWSSGEGLPFTISLNMCESERIVKRAPQPPAEAKPKAKAKAKANANATDNKTRTGHLYIYDYDFEQV